MTAGSVLQHIQGGRFGDDLYDIELLGEAVGLGGTGAHAWFEFNYTG